MSIGVPYLLLALVAFGVWVTQTWGWLALAGYLLALAVLEFAIKVAINLNRESEPADESDTAQ